jgi:hypothetical protein
MSRAGQIPVGSPFQEIQFPLKTKKTDKKDSFTLNKSISARVKPAFISTFCAGDDPDQARGRFFCVLFDSIIKTPIFIE